MQGVNGFGALPCEGCPEQALTEYLVSPVGQLISSVVDLDFAVQEGVNVTLADIPYPVFLLMRQLAEERTRYQKEEMDKIRGK